MPGKKFTRKEVQEQTGDKNVFIIENLVYDVVSFLDEHPGGHEVMVKAKGTDVTEDYLDVGHGLDAQELMRKFQIGELVDEEKVEVKRKKATWEDASVEQASFWGSWKVPLLLGVLATLLYSYLF